MSEKIIVQYYTKQVYGSTLMYLVKSDAANAIGNLLKQKTISSYQMSNFETLGVKFMRVFEPGT